MNDDPELDGTDGAHPAWWRGNDDGVKSVVQILQKIIDGKDDGGGTMGYEPLEKLRRDMLAFRQALLDVAKHPHNTYPGDSLTDGGAYASGYRTGVTDGHRCAANVARIALGMPTS